MDLTVYLPNLITIGLCATILCVNVVLLRKTRKMPFLLIIIGFGLVIIQETFLISIDYTLLPVTLMAQGYGFGQISQILAMWGFIFFALNVGFYICLIIGFIWLAIREPRV